VFFIALDSNRDSGEQEAWLEERLRAAAGADFIIVMFHHPPYSRKRDRREAEIAENWAPLFDRYGVDLVLNGHDHVYMRTKKIRGGQAAGEGEDGVTYVVANASEKFYRLEASENARTQLADTGTYQLVTVKYDEAGSPSLIYRAYDFEHRLIDDFSIRHD
jgi:3',5'-cyclic AMP phosphodiesterase CpdA